MEALMINIRNLYEDEANTRVFYPKTHIKAVINDDNKTLEEILNLQILIEMDNIVTKGSSNPVTSDGIYNYVNEQISNIIIDTGEEIVEDVTNTLSGWETNDSSVWLIDSSDGFNGTIVCKASTKYKRIGINLTSIPLDSELRISFDSDIPYYIKRAAGIGKFSSLGSTSSYNSIEPDLIGSYNSDSLGVFICDENGHYDFTFKKTSNYITLGADSHKDDINKVWNISNFKIELITQSSGSGSSLSDIFKKFTFTSSIIPSEYTYERYMTISGNSTTGNGQGSCVLGNYFFNASSVNSSGLLGIKIYNLETKELVLTLILEGITNTKTHANTISFSNANSLYIPSGYPSSGSNSQVYVYKFNGEPGNYTATKIQTITLNGFSTTWSDFVVDSEHSRCWIRSNFTYWLFNLPSEESLSITLTPNNALDSFTLPNLIFGYNVTTSSNLGLMYHKGRIWLTSGVPSYSGQGAESCCIIVINTRSKCRESVIWLDDLGLTSGISNTYEPEGIFIWNNLLYIPYRTFIAKIKKVDLV